MTLEKIIVPAGSRLSSITVLMDDDEQKAEAPARKKIEVESMDIKKQLQNLRELYGDGAEGDAQATKILREAWLADANERAEFTSFEHFCAFHKDTLSHNVKICGARVAR